MASSSLRSSLTITVAAAVNNGRAGRFERRAATSSRSANDFVCSIQVGVFLDFMDERGGGATVERGGFGRGIGGFKVFVVVGDSKSYVGLGVKCSKEVATAIRGAIIVAKLWVIPVRRGYKIGKPYTMHCKVTGKCGSVIVGMVLAPCGSGIVVARVPKKVFQFAGIDDVFTSSKGSTKTLETLSRNND